LLHISAIHGLREPPVRGEKYFAGVVRRFSHIVSLH